MKVHIFWEGFGRVGVDFLKYFDMCEVSGFARVPGDMFIGLYVAPHCAAVRGHLKASRILVCMWAQKEKKTNEDRPNSPVSSYLLEGIQAAFWKTTSETRKHICKQSARKGGINIPADADDAF